MARSRTISQDAFFVAPQLIGLPLASGRRRLVAMLLDLLLVAILVNLGGGTLLGLAAAAFFFRLATRGATSRMPKWLRAGVAVVGALLLLNVVSSLWDSATEKLKESAEIAVGVGDTTPVQGSIGPRQAIGMAAAVASLSSVNTEAEARRRAPQVTAQLRAAGQSDETIRDMYRDIANDDERGRTWLMGVLMSSLDGPGTAAPAAKADTTPKAAPDSVVASLAAALRSKRADTLALKRAVVPIVAHDTLAALQHRVDEAHEARDEARRDLREARNDIADYESRGFLGTFAKMADELGLGFGWTGLYFTTMLVLLRGQTPGKKVLGIRVMRLNGERMTYWSSFERFGGYAASIFTGLLGFAQIIWDRNRQGMHDKIVETVVVRDFGNLLAPNIPAVPDRVAVPNPAHTAAVLAAQAARRAGVNPPGASSSSAAPPHPPTAHDGGLFGPGAPRVDAGAPYPPPPPAGRAPMAPPAAAPAPPAPPVVHGRGTEGDGA